MIPKRNLAFEKVAVRIAAGNSTRTIIRQFGPVFAELVFVGT